MSTSKANPSTRQERSVPDSIASSSTAKAPMASSQSSIARTSRKAMSTGGRTSRERGARGRGYAGLLRSGGIGKGDRVAILAQNSILYFEALFAVTGAGASLVPLNHLLIGRELVAILEDAGVKAA